MTLDKFTVDTHLFRELGELLVGRDSTALVELIKNAYDADATTVVVDGEFLDDPENGRITINDDGVGMTPDQFEQGFLRIASRLKDEGTHKSVLHNRRYTGAKGIGRLAAHKLARLVRINSIASESIAGSNGKTVKAAIDWDLVESVQTLDQLGGSGAIELTTEARREDAKPGTTIELLRLRRRWSSTERARFFAEVQTFEPPSVLVKRPTVVDLPLLFEEPKVYDTRASDPGFRVELTGEFEAGEDYWQALAQAAHWIIEIDASKKLNQVNFWITPTKEGQQRFPDARQQRFSMDHPDSRLGPFFQARVLIREGVTKNKELRAWQGRSSGIRVYMEGFRVLPYGEPADDWLSLDADYVSRTKTLSFLSEMGFDEKPEAKEGLVFLRKNAYFGAVFLTLSNSPALRLLVNREGFIPESGYYSLVEILRTGIYLSVRARAAATLSSREERSHRRASQAADKVNTSRLNLRQAVDLSVERANNLAREARKLAAVGNFDEAVHKINQAAAEFLLSSQTSERLMTEGKILRILASVGTQMTAFVHEINGILGSAIALEGALTRLRQDESLAVSARRKLAKTQTAIGDLRRAVERQASYLTDVVSPDARRRRSRQKLAERFDAGTRLVKYLAEQKGIEIMNEIPPELKSLPMFPAELTVVFSNLLTNAIKAAGPKGRIRATATVEQDGSTVMRIENTGVRVDPSKGDRWFRPFESTTVSTDPVLGQGMGMGLPITRNMLEEYGASIEFGTPSAGYSTCLEIRLPK